MYNMKKFLLLAFCFLSLNGLYAMNQNFYTDFHDRQNFLKHLQDLQNTTNNSNQEAAQLLNLCKESLEELATKGLLTITAAILGCVINKTKSFEEYQLLSYWAVVGGGIATFSELVFFLSKCCRYVRARGNYQYNKKMSDPLELAYKLLPPINPDFNLL
jgi:hypothetical protein